MKLELHKFHITLPIVSIYVTLLSMTQDKLLVQALKSVLKQKNLTYKDIGLHLSLSEGSVKRLFANYDLSLKRLQSICTLANIELSDLVDMMRDKTLATDVLPIEHETELVSDIKLLLTAHLLINKWKVNQILAHYDIDRLTMTTLLSQLDRMKIIDYLPGERVRLKISRNFTWLENGPINEFFTQHIESEFFDCSFTSPGEIKLFVSGMLTKNSNVYLQRQIKKLATHFDDSHIQDTHEALSDKFGTSMVIAMRPWDIERFKQLRKPNTYKVFDTN